MRNYPSCSLFGSFSYSYDCCYTKPLQNLSRVPLRTLIPSSPAETPSIGTLKEAPKSLHDRQITEALDVVCSPCLLVDRVVELLLEAITNLSVFLPPPYPFSASKVNHIWLHRWNGRIQARAFGIRLSFCGSGSRDKGLGLRV